MPRPLSTPGKDPVPTVQEARWVPGPVWTAAKNLAAIEIRSPDRPTRSQSLHRLSYPAHAFQIKCLKMSHGRLLAHAFVFIFSQFSPTFALSLMWSGAMIGHLVTQHCSSRLQTETNFTPAEIAPMVCWSGYRVGRWAGLGVGTEKHKFLSDQEIASLSFD
jgi:hypothetical protein